MKGYTKPSRQWSLHMGSTGPGGARRLELIAQRTAGLVRGDRTMTYPAAAAAAMADWHVSTGSLAASLIYAQSVQDRARAINRERARRVQRDRKAIPNLPVPPIMPWDQKRAPAPTMPAWERRIRARVSLEPSTSTIGRAIAR